MQYRTFANEIWRQNVETWYILQHRNPGTANTVLPKNLQHWRADTIRPYAVCATELQVQKFRCTNEVFRDLLYAGAGAGKKIFPPGTEYFLKSH